MKPVKPIYVVKLFNNLTEISDANAPTSKIPVSAYKRGNIRGFSIQSFRGLLRLINKIGRTDPCYFVTLTYQNWEEEFSIWKRDLDTFLKALKRRFLGCCGFWRFEFQQRGAPHFHLLIWHSELDGFLNTDIREDKEWLSYAWARITNNMTSSAIKYGTDLVLVNNPKDADFYLTLYLKKRSIVYLTKHTGRHWGTWNREGLKCDSPLLEIQINEQQFFKIRRAFRRIYIVKNGRKSKSSYYYKYILNGISLKKGSYFISHDQIIRLVDFILKR